MTGHSEQESHLSTSCGATHPAGDPCVSRMTPPGRGAIATLVVEGRSAPELVEKLLDRKGRGRLRLLPIGGVAVVKFQPPGHPGETVVVGKTGPHTIELHCHGGAAAARRIEAALLGQGGRAANWPEWICRVEKDPIAAAARRELAAARTRSTAAVLLDQYNGVLHQAVSRVVNLLEQRRGEEAVERLEELLGWLPLGLHLTRPWKVVLAGEPNVGKSSLINRLVGKQRVIVHHRPGTTRDPVTELTALGGWPVELCDTAGLRRTADPVESAGVGLAAERLQAADLVVLIFDASRPWTSDDGDFRRHLLFTTSVTCGRIARLADLQGWLPAPSGAMAWRSLPGRSASAWCLDRPRRERRYRLRSSRAGSYRGHCTARAKSSTMRPLKCCEKCLVPEVDFGAARRTGQLSAMQEQRYVKETILAEKGRR